MTTVMTTVTSNRTRPREKLGARIYEAAIAAFRERGYRAATVEDITHRAGVAKGTFFNFYRSKIDVLADYYGRLDERVAHFRSELDSSRPVAALHSYAVRMERLFEAEGALLVDLLSVTGSDAQMRSLDHDSGVSDARAFAAFLERAKAAGAVRARVDSAEAGELIVNLWTGSVRRWLADHPRGGLAETFRTKIRMLFEGLEETPR